MARRRKQTHDPRQLSLFDAMANQIEEIREENILDDTREGSIPIPVTQVEQEQAVPAMPLQVEPVKEEERQPEPARTKKPFPFPTNDGEKRRLGVNGRGDSVYELQDGSRMYSPNPDIMQFLDGEKRTPEKLFEAGADDFCDAVIAVLAPHDTRVSRIIERDHLPEEAARARIDAQPPDSFYRAKCGYIIENNGDLDTLYRDTDALYQILMK